MERVLRPPLAAVAALRVRLFIARDPDFDTTLRFVRRFKARGVAISIIQVDSEIRAFCSLVRASQAKTVLEIGTAGGGTLALFAQSALEDATLVSVDLPAPCGYVAGTERVYYSFRRKQQKIVLIRADSHDRSTVELVREGLGDTSIDVLFIDGDHSATGVARDFELYSPLVRPGGIVAFHDIVPYLERKVGGVPQFWQEIKGATGGEAYEIVEDWIQRGCGIGVIRLPRNPAVAA